MVLQSRVTNESFKPLSACWIFFWYSKQCLVIPESRSYWQSCLHNKNVSTRIIHSVNNASKWPVAVPTQLEIDSDYHPDLAKHKACTARCLEQNPELLRATLPPVSPPRSMVPSFGRGKTGPERTNGFTSQGRKSFKRLRRRWNTLRVQSFLSSNVIIIFDRALTGLNKSMGYINRETFPAPNLGPRLYDLAKKLYTGRGFFALRIILADRYTLPSLLLSMQASTEKDTEKTPLVVYDTMDYQVFHHMWVPLEESRMLLVLSSCTSKTWLSATLTRRVVSVTRPIRRTSKSSTQTLAIALFALDNGAEGGTSRISSGLHHLVMIILNDISCP